MHHIYTFTCSWSQGFSPLKWRWNWIVTTTTLPRIRFPLLTSRKITCGISYSFSHFKLPVKLKIRWQLGPCLDKNANLASIYADCHIKPEKKTYSEATQVKRKFNTIYSNCFDFKKVSSCRNRPVQKTVTSESREEFLPRPIHTTSQPIQD